MTGDLDRRLAALAEAAELAEGRLDAGAVGRARGVVERAGRRLGLGVETTVVAFAGPTGAGKSTLFNALAGDEVVTTGRRRPTTSVATAATWGEASDELLAWLQVARRHRAGERPGEGGGALVVVDLPDFDSVERAHRVEVERLLELVDLVVWVVDPQKYADGALHERYLRPLAAHGEAMLVVLNQADVLDPAGLAACRADLGGLLRSDGLDGVPVLALSARTGARLDELRAELEARVRARTAVTARLAADVHVVAAALAPTCAGRAGEVTREDRARVREALARAAGVPDVVRAVDRAHRRRGALATGWPVVRWVRRLRPDPLRRLRLADRGTAPELRTSLPPPSPVQRAQVAAAARALAAGAAGDAAEPWPRLVREAAVASEDEVGDRLEATVARTDLRVTRPRWWTAGDALQRALVLVTLAGLLWLLVLAGLGLLRLDDVLPLPDVLGIPLPTLLLAAGVLGGLLVALLARVVNGWGARRRARTAGRALRRGTDEAADALVVAPVERELALRERLCASLSAAAESASRSRGPFRSR